MKNTEKSFASDKVIGQTRGVSRLHSDRVPSNEVHQVKFNKQTDERGEGDRLIGMFYVDDWPKEKVRRDLNPRKKVNKRRANVKSLLADSV